MRIVKTLADIERLKAAGVLPAALLARIRADFTRLAGELGGGEPEAAFSLAGFGPIVVLESGDDPFDLSPLGVDPGWGGLAGSAEFVERVASR